MDTRAERDQQRRAIADRRGGREIAAQRGAIADSAATRTAAATGGKPRARRSIAPRCRSDGSAAPIRTAVATFAKFAQLRDAFQADQIRDHRRNRRLDSTARSVPPAIHRASGSPRRRARCIPPGSPAARTRNQHSSYRTASSRAPARPGARGNRRRARGPEIEAASRDRPVARAAAQIAAHGVRVARALAAGPVVFREQAHDEARACSSRTATRRAAAMRLLRLGQFARLPREPLPCRSPARPSSEEIAGNCSPAGMRFRERRRITIRTVQAPHSPSAQPSFAAG